MSTRKRAAFYFVPSPSGEVIAYAFPGRSGYYEVWDIKQDPKEFLERLGLTYDPTSRAYPGGGDVMRLLQEKGRMVSWGYAE